LLSACIQADHRSSIRRQRRRILRREAQDDPFYLFRRPMLSQQPAVPSSVRA
jgi:hypothetical protein